MVRFDETEIPQSCWNKPNKCHSTSHLYLLSIRDTVIYGGLIQIKHTSLREYSAGGKPKPTPIFTSWESHLPAYKEKLIQYYSTSLKLSDSLYGRFPDAGAEDDVKALATLLVEIVWQCGWSTTHNVSELWWPLLDRFKMLIQEIDEYNKLTDTEFFDFFARGFDNLFQKNEEEPLTISSHTPPFPSILEPLKISEDARRAGYSDNIEIFAPYINPGPSKN